MSRDKKDAAIARAIHAHDEWKAKWVKDDRFFSVDWISPHGKTMTYSGYCFEVRKHMTRTVAKIRKILEVV